MLNARTFGVTLVSVAFIGSALAACDRGEEAEQSSLTASAAPGAKAAVHAAVLSALDTNDEVNVIVNFKDDSPHSALHAIEAHRLRIARTRDAILAAVPQGFSVRRSFGHVPAVAGRLSRQALDALAKDPNVESIQIDETGAGALLQSVPAIHGDVAKKTYNVSGKGVRVAVLDSGVSSTHPDLKASLVSTQHCFTQFACPPNNMSEGTNAEDDNGHGSHVAGIVTADGIMTNVGPGFAPDAEIVAVKVDDKNDSGQISDWVAGLDWVYSNLSTLKVKIINMSICSSSLYGSASECDAQQPALAKAVKNLVDAGVTIFAASGNMGDKAKLSAPACNTGSIAVGATYKSDQGRQPDNGRSYSQWGGFGDCSDATTAFDQVACFTNSGPRLDMVAPGAIIVSAYMGSTQYGIYRGTSQASPTAAGVAALMLQCNPALKPAEVKDILIRTAVTVKDTKNGLSFPSIRADLAVKEACANASNDAGAGGASGSGGATGVGGMTGAGGGTGGSSGKGGQVGNGGAISTAGSSGNGGQVGSGGATSTAGSSGTAGQVGVGGASSVAGGSSGGAGQVGNGGASSVAGGSLGSGGAMSGRGGATTATGSGGKTTAGGNGGRNGSGGQTTSAGSSSSGCSCELGAQPKTSLFASLASFASLVGLALVRRRRRQS